MINLMKRFTILTDENPRFKNYSRHTLKYVLDLNKISYIEVVGVYQGDKENSYLTSLTPNQARIIGKAFGQESVLCVEMVDQKHASKNELRYCQEDQPDVSGYGYRIQHEVPEEDCYTILPDGSFLVVHLDF